MPDQLLRCIPSSSNGATVLTLEGLLHGRTWRPLATIQPDVRVSARDTLNLDIFAPRLTWQTHTRTPSLLSLKGGNGGLRLSTIVSVHSHDMLRIETRLTVRRPVRLELARDLLHLADIPITRVWSPLQTPLPEMIVGDFAFHTPLAAIETPNACLAIIPNLRLLTAHRRVPTALSCDLPSRQFAYGCVPYHLLRDTYCVHYDTDSVELHGVLVYAYFLYFQNDCKPGTGLRRAVHRVWQLYAVTRALQAAPQRRPFEEPVSYTHL
ncbi:MAG: hypothetical protein N2595_03660, partial [bacterium]|nr:hypothetical protein [bacterium]